MKKSNLRENYDAIIIGSGMGGLTVASLLAQIGKKRVLILERHFKLGGFTHSFRRGHYEWDVGVHYIGEMHPNGMCRRIMDRITGNQVQWHRCGPIMERFHFPESTFEVPDDPELFKSRLLEQFPNEKTHIERYFRDVRRCQGWIARWFFSKVFPNWLGSLVSIPRRQLASQTTAGYLKPIQSDLLKAILTAQWPDFGTPPAKSAFAFHSAVTGDYFRGFFYPEGGSKKIAAAVQQIVESHGGTCLVNHQVDEILIENGKAVGVRARNKNQECVFRAPVIVSNAGAATTFTKFLPGDVCHAEKEKVTRMQRGTSAMALFLGLKEDPRLHGFDDANYWFFRSLDHDRAANQTQPFEIAGGYLSFGSLRNPGTQHHTAQIVTFSDYDPWKQFAKQPWLNRGQDYESLKAQVVESMLQLADSYVPKLRGLIDYAELSTPLSFEHFSNHPSGMIYGPMCDPNRLSRDAWSIKTSLPSLYLAGSDIGSPGINGAMMSSIFTAAIILGPMSFVKIFGPANS